ncbi:MAG: cadherin repeat domain-containing protein [Magnetococcus sp. YQC-9]
MAYQAAASDPDTAHGDTLAWSLLPGADAGLFNIDPATGAVTFKTPPDFEDGHGPTYTITVVVTDVGGLNDTKAVTINVTDVNEAPVIQAPFTANFAENGTGVAYSPVSLDPDTAHGDVLTWSITGGIDKDLFNINASTGAVTFINPPNHELPADAGGNNVYDLNITVTDTAGLFDTRSVTITVTNANDQPVVTSAVTIGPLVEGDTVTGYSATATDEDAGSVFTWSLSGTDATSFTIDPVTGVLSMSPAVRFDLPAGQTQKALNFTLEATDNGIPTAPTPTRTGTLVATVNVISKINLSTLSFYVNADHGTVIAQLSALNPGAGTFTFALTSNPNNLFQLRGNGANVYLAVSDSPVPSFVANTDYPITIQMVDTVSGSVFTRNVNITALPVPFDLSGGVAADGNEKANAEFIFKDIIKTLYRAPNAPASPTLPYDLSETQLARLILGKLDQQVTRGGAFPLQSVVPKIWVQIYPSDKTADQSMVRVRVRIGLIKSMYQRLPASVQTEVGNWFDTFFDTIAPFAFDYTTDVELRLLPDIRSAVDGNGNTYYLFCINLSQSTVDILNLRMLPRISMDMVAMLTRYNQHILPLLKSDGSLSFFTGGGGHGPALHFLGTASREMGASGFDEKAVGQAFKNQVNSDGRVVKSYDATTQTGQQIPLSQIGADSYSCQRIDYYLPGWINGISLTPGYVHLTR